MSSRETKSALGLQSFSAELSILSSLPAGPEPLNMTISTMLSFLLDDPKEQKLPYQTRQPRFVTEMVKVVSSHEQACTALAVETGQVDAPPENTKGGLCKMLNVASGEQSFLERSTRLVQSPRAATLPHI